MKKGLILLVSAIIVLSSCEELFFEGDLGSTNALENFDYLWEEVDKKYSYFELKNIDWDELKNIYRPRITDNTTEEELFEVLADMLDELKDDHTNLVSPFNVFVHNVALQSSVNYNARTLEEFYLTDAWSTGVFTHDFLDNEEIGYIRYSSFLSEFTDDQFDFILNRYKDTKGLIIDLRMNGGGSIFNVPKILGRFTQEKILVAQNITRNGLNHDDFSEPEDLYITPYDGMQYLKPIIVLIDRGSYSSTTFFALATKALPKITLIGDTTGGGGGLPNGGQLPNGWTYRFSITQILDLEGKNYAEDGVPADIPAAFDWNDLTKDEILDRAILELQ